MESAIKIAIENGYLRQAHTYGKDFYTNDRMYEIRKWWDDASSKHTSTDQEHLALSAGYGVGWRDCMIFLDPLFWQALGKKLGWDNDPMYCTSGCGCAYPNGDGSHEFGCVWKKNINWYGQYWHEFIEHLAEGKDIDSFFNALLVNHD